MDVIKLKDDVDFEKLKELGFEPDPANCDHPADHYYHLNNYYAAVGENFRVTVNTVNRSVDVLCLAGSAGLHNMANIKPLFDLLSSGLVEAQKK